MSLTLRSTKGSALTHTEMDNNFLALQPKETISADNGDASITLTSGTSDPVQLFSTALTANRTITLSTTDALEGDKFRIVRTGLGAFTLDVGGLKTMPSATAAWCDVHYDGAAWILTAYGSL